VGRSLSLLQAVLSDVMLELQVAALVCAEADL
jgi:hypothetical protein